MNVKNDLLKIMIKQIKRCDTIDELFEVFLDIEDVKATLTDLELAAIDQEYQATACRIIYPCDAHLSGYQLN